jgi:hypothetical protein
MMQHNQYKKIAGTAAVFVLANNDKPSPVERDGMIWQGDELHLNLQSTATHKKTTMANALALEGLEEYDPPTDGDIRHVNSIEKNFIYVEAIKGWVQWEATNEKVANSL